MARTNTQTRSLLAGSHLDFLPNNSTHLHLFLLFLSVLGKQNSLKGWCTITVLFFNSDVFFTWFSFPLVNFVSIVGAPNNSTIHFWHFLLVLIINYSNFISYELFVSRSQYNLTNVYKIACCFTPIDRTQSFSRT